MPRPRRPSHALRPGTRGPCRPGAPAPGRGSPAATARAGAAATASRSSSARSCPASAPPAPSRTPAPAPAPGQGSRALAFDRTSTGRPRLRGRAHRRGRRQRVAAREVGHAQRREAAHHVERQPDAAGRGQPAELPQVLAGLRVRGRAGASAPAGGQQAGTAVCACCSAPRAACRRTAACSGRGPGAAGR